MYERMYIQYIQGLCQSRLSTANHALLLISPATTAVYSLEDFTSGSWPSLYSLGTDLTENTASSSSSIVTCVSVEAIT
jgi:hypothetical protein